MTNPQSVGRLEDSRDLHQDLSRVETAHCAGKLLLDKKDGSAALNPPASAGSRRWGSALRPSDAADQKTVGSPRPSALLDPDHERR